MGTTFFKCFLFYLFIHIYLFLLNFLLFGTFVVFYQCLIANKDIQKRTAMRQRGRNNADGCQSTLGFEPGGVGLLCIIAERLGVESRDL